MPRMSPPKPGPALECISPWSAFSIGGILNAGVIGVGATVAWPTANRAIFIPFVLPKTMVVTQAVIGLGATATGNLDVGVYDRFGNRIVSLGSTAKGTQNAEFVANLTDTTLLPGLYYMALATDGVTGYIACAPVAAGVCQAAGMKQMATAFALPATATFAAAASAYVPVFSLWGTAL